MPAARTTPCGDRRAANTAWASVAPMLAAQLAGHACTTSCAVQHLGVRASWFHHACMGFAVVEHIRFHAFERAFLTRSADSIATCTMAGARQLAPAASAPPCPSHGSTSFKTLVSGGQAGWPLPHGSISAPAPDLSAAGSESKASQSSSGRCGRQAAAADSATAADRVPGCRSELLECCASSRIT